VSAGASGEQPAVDADLGKLAPRFRAAVQSALVDCAAAGYDAMVYEALRSQQLQAIYYARGRSVMPPPTPVTNAQSNLYSWHGFGLAVDVISRSRQWNQPESWFKAVADIFKKYGCAWGGDWTQADLPHMQWGRCKPSPSDLARELIGKQGMQAVWQAVGADAVPEAAAAAAPAAPAAAAAVAAAVEPAPPPPTEVPAAHAPAPPPQDIVRLQLNDNAQNAAVILRAAYPGTVFTSGRRSIQDQAHAMAGNVVKNRQFIVQTYKASPTCSQCQQWVDSHPQATTQDQIAAGLLQVFQAAPESEVMKFSRHLSGNAFDVQPVLADAEAIVAFIRKLPLLELFLDHEAGLVRWHAQFYQ
jgi:peptidoglycan L-alanyl-D-glutamate endopeptidase CwlK